MGNKEQVSHNQFFSIVAITLNERETHFWNGDSTSCLIVLKYSRGITQISPKKNTLYN